MATSRHVMLMVVATLVVLFVGSAHAGGDYCPYGYKNCDYRKSDCETCILNDVKNCGDCGKECKAKPYTTVKCENKQCVYKYECKADIYNDVNNCGKCGNKCEQKPGMTVKCQNKQCVYKYECKADIYNDVNNCGKCGNKCEQKPDMTVKCENKQCVYKKKCYADTKKDVNNCGKCGNQCKVEWQGGEVKCQDGQCKQQCKYGYEYDWNKKCCVEKKKY